MIPDNLLSNRLNSFKNGKFIQIPDQTINSMKTNKEDSIVQDKNVNSIKQQTPEIKNITKSSNSWLELYSNFINLIIIIFKAFCLGFFLKIFGLTPTPLECFFYGIALYTIFTLIKDTIHK